MMLIVRLTGVLVAFVSNLSERLTIAVAQDLICSHDDEVTRHVLCGAPVSQYILITLRYVC